MSSTRKAQRRVSAQQVTDSHSTNRLTAQQQQLRQNGKRKILSTNLLERFRHNRELPLNLILLITGWLDDVGDISRVTRTSRLLYYMTLPRLWQHVTLHSYSGIRYKDGRPEGFGSGSPFSMALESLVSRQVSQYVTTLRLVGEWREVDVDEFSMGRVPDNTMMLNIVVRAALDKCVNLKSFSWELNVKPLKTIYQGLAALKSLQSLTLRFPSRRIPRPTTLILPIPNLRYLCILDIDPLCYPDDLSSLLASCTKLETLKLEWSPRIRREKEPSVSMDSYFGRAVAANVKLPLKHMALKNLYARNQSEHSTAFAFNRMESLTFLNCSNSNDPGSVFFDSTWRMNPPDWSSMTKVKKLRFDSVDRNSVEFLVQLHSGLKEVYIVNERQPASQTSTPIDQNGNSVFAPAPPDTPIQIATPSQSACASSGGDCIAALTTHHGQTLRKLLLSDRWSLSDDILDLLVKSCPNLEQLGVALEGQPFQRCRRISSQLPKLRAIRVLSRQEEKMIQLLSAAEESLEMERRGMEIIAREVGKPEYRQINYFGLSGRAYEFGKMIPASQAVDSGQVMKREIKLLTWDEVKVKCEIFGMDSFEL